MEDRVPVPLLAAGVTLVGALAGFAVHAWLFPAQPEVVTRVVTEAQLVPDKISDDKLQALCATLTASDKELIQAAQERVMSLRDELETREKELADLRAERARAKEAGAEVAAKLRSMEAEISRLRAQLVEVTAERDGLMVELKQTVAKLDAQIRETEKYKAEAKKWKRKSTENAWRSFVAEAKVQICDKGTRKRHEVCHEAVDQALDAPVQDRFESCVDTWQAVPALVQAESKKAELPTFAYALSDKQFTSTGWYIQFCDPTLPEAGQEI